VGILKGPFAQITASGIAAAYLNPFDASYELAGARYFLAQADDPHEMEVTV
jgi:hypothetical protein